MGVPVGHRAKNYRVIELEPRVQELPVLNSFLEAIDLVQNLYDFLVPQNFEILKYSLSPKEDLNVPMPVTEEAFNFWSFVFALLDIPFLWEVFDHASLKLIVEHKLGVPNFSLKDQVFIEDIKEVGLHLSVLNVNSFALL